MTPQEAAELILALDLQSARVTLARPYEGVSDVNPPPYSDLRRAAAALFTALVGCEPTADQLQCCILPVHRVNRDVVPIDAGESILDYWDHER